MVTTSGSGNLYCSRFWVFLDCTVLDKFTHNSFGIVLVLEHNQKDVSVTHIVRFAPESWLNGFFKL